MTISTSSFPCSLPPISWVPRGWLITYSADWLVFLRRRVLFCQTLKGWKAALRVRSSSISLRPLRCPPIIILSHGFEQTQLDKKWRAGIEKRKKNPKVNKIVSFILTQVFFTRLLVFLELYIYKTSPISWLIRLRTGVMLATFLSEKLQKNPERYLPFQQRPQFLLKRTSFVLRSETQFMNGKKVPHCHESRKMNKRPINERTNDWVEWRRRPTLNKRQGADNAPAPPPRRQPQNLSKYTTEAHDIHQMRYPPTAESMNSLPSKNIIQMWMNYRGVFMNRSSFVLRGEKQCFTNKWQLIAFRSSWGNIWSWTYQRNKYSKEMPSRVNTLFNPSILVQKQKSRYIFDRDATLTVCTANVPFLVSVELTQVLRRWFGIILK